MTGVRLEQGRTRTSACAVDRPGRARRGRSDGAAPWQLPARADRDAGVVDGVVPGELPVAGRVPGTSTASRPLRDAVRRSARHVLDPAWEIEDEDPVGAPPRRTT